MTITYDDFLAVDVRVGTVVDARPFPEARRPAYILMIDFGSEIGIKKSSAQITKNYTPEQLIGTQVAAVVNFPPKQIGPLKSEVLTLGFSDANNEVVLIRPTHKIPNGGRFVLDNLPFQYRPRLCGGDTAPSENPPVFIT